MVARQKTVGGRMKAKRRAWTPAEDAIMRAKYPTHSAHELAPLLNRQPKAIWQRAYDLGIRKSRDWLAERARQANLREDHGGRAHRFQPGNKPWNRDTEFNAGGRSPETRYAPGNRSGMAVALWQPIGALRLKDGYLERKINDDFPIHRRWRGEHLVIWEAVNGPLPKGHAIVFKDGDRTNITMDNLELVTRRELMLRNTVHRHGPEIAALSQLRGALARQINRRTQANPPEEIHHEQ